MNFIYLIYNNLFELWTLFMILSFFYLKKKRGNTYEVYYIFVNVVYYSYLIFLLFYMTNSALVDFLNSTFFLQINKIIYTEVKLNYLVILYLYLFICKNIFLLLNRFMIKNETFLFVTLGICIINFLILYLYKNVSREIFNSISVFILSTDVNLIFLAIVCIKYFLVLQFLIFSVLFFIEKEYSNLKFAYANDITVICYITIISLEIFLTLLNKPFPQYFCLNEKFLALFMLFLWVLNNIYCLREKFFLPCNHKLYHLQKLKTEKYYYLFEIIDKRTFGRIRPYYLKKFFDKIKQYEVFILINTIMLPPVILFYFPLVFFGENKLVVFSLFMVIAYAYEICAVFPTLKKALTRSGINCCKASAFRGVFFQRVEQLLFNTKFKGHFSEFLKRVDEQQVLVRVSVAAGVVAATYAGISYHDKDKPVITIVMPDQGPQPIHVQTKVSDYLFILKTGYDLDIECIKRKENISPEEQAKLMLLRNEKFEKDLKQVHNELTAFGVDRVPVGFALHTVVEEKEKKTLLNKININDLELNQKISNTPDQLENDQKKVPSITKGNTAK